MNTIEMVADSGSGLQPIVCRDEAEGPSVLLDKQNAAALGSASTPPARPSPTLRSPTADRLAGRVLAERYRLGACIGTGAMGAVYCAQDLQHDRTCAVKVMQAREPLENAAVMRFLDEARLLSRLCHPNVVEIYDSGETEDGILFLVMELLAGHDLDVLLKRQPRLPLQQTLDIALQVASGLHTVHLSGIVHRDIKPRNIFLVPSDGQQSAPNNDSTSQRCSHYQVKIIDFGLAKTLASHGWIRGSDGLLIGTPEYLPPESWWGVSQHVDTRADQWALAVIVFRMLSGQLPFECADGTLMLGREIQQRPPRSLRALVPDVPVHVEEALNRALCKDKDGRFANVLDFMRALRRLPQSPQAPLIAGPFASMETLRVRVSERQVAQTEELTARVRETQPLKTEEPPTKRMTLPQQETIPAASLIRRPVARWPWALLTAALILFGAVAVHQRFSRRCLGRAAISRALSAPLDIALPADTGYTLPTVQGAQHWVAPAANASRESSPDSALPTSGPRLRSALPPSHGMPTQPAARPLRVSTHSRHRVAKGQI